MGLKGMHGRAYRSVRWAHEAGLVFPEGKMPKALVNYELPEDVANAAGSLLLSDLQATFPIQFFSAHAIDTSYASNFKVRLKHIRGVGR